MPRSTTNAPSSLRCRRIGILAGSLMAALSAQAAAQSATTEEQPQHAATELDRITVTAQKRQESVIDVPISISVISAEEIEARRIVSVDDFIESIPNATFTKYSTFSPIVSLRGISSMTGGQYDPIGITVDDVSYGTVENEIINSARFLDIERIEVLRGPQGTLTGSNSMGGTINYILAKPDPEAFEFKGIVDFSRFDTRLLKAIINTPLSDNAALRTVVYNEYSGGATKNVGPGGGDSGYDNAGGRLALRWKPTDKLTIDASVAGEQQNRGIDPYAYIDLVWDDPGAVNARQLAESLGVRYDDPKLGFIHDIGMDGSVVALDTRAHQRIDNFMASLRLNYAAEKHDFDFIYGYYDFHHRATNMDVDRTEFAGGRYSYDRYNTSNSLEVRMTSRYDGPINWVAGAVWHDEDQPYDEVYEPGVLDENGNFVIGGNYVFGSRWGNGGTLTTRALFGNLTWDLTERLHWSVGGRFTRSSTKYGWVGGEDGVQDPLPPIEWTRAELNKFTPRTTLNFDLSKDVTVYAQYATGFRDGYGNGQAAGLHQTSRGEFDVPADVKAEDVVNYEVGLKGMFLDNRLAINAAVFYMDYTDLQVYGGWVLEEDIPTEPGFDLNAGKASIRGFELEATLRPIAGLTLKAGYGYVDSNIEEIEDWDGTVIRDSRMPGVRPHTLNLSASYEHPVADGVWAFYRADYNRVAESNDDPANYDPANSNPAYKLLDASLGVKFDNWELSLYAENVLGEIWYSGINTPGYPIHGSFVYYAPRTYGIRASFRFGGR